MQAFIDGFLKFCESTGIALLFNPESYIWWQTLIMIAVACVLLYLAIVKKFEPLLLVPIAFGMLLANLPQTSNLMHPEWFSDPAYFVDGQINYGRVLNEGGLLDMLYLGVKLGIYPPLIFLGIGAMTDFGPLIANPKSILLGAAAQLGVFFTFLGALFIGDMGWANFRFNEASSIGIIGGADGPTAIFVTKTLAPTLLPGNRDCGVLVYGARSDYPAADHEGADDEERAQRRDGTAPSCIETGKDSVPNFRYHCCWFDCSGCDFARRHVDAW